MARSNLPPLTALRAFVAAGELGSFQDAARELGVTPSAVSHQVRSLETWLQVSLFVRSARRVELTKPGRMLLKETERAFQRIADAVDRVRPVSRTAPLRVSALPLFTSAWLIPRLGAFEAKHPDITLEIETSNRVADLERDKVDVAIRNLRAPTSGVSARKLLDIRGVPVCAPSLLKGKVPLLGPADLANHTLIHVTARPEAWSNWLKGAGVSGLKGKRNLSFDTVPAALDAAAGGSGVALGMHPLIWEAEVSSRLVVPFASPVPGDSSYYVVHRKHDADRADVRAFVSWLVKEMAAFRAKHQRRD